MKTLLEYLSDLAKDPVAQQVFKKDPEAAIADSGLGDDDKAILRTRNNAAIQAAVGQQALQTMIYPTPPPFIYASQPPFIYAQPPFIYAQHHAQQSAPFIYAQQPSSYAQSAPFIYAQQSSSYAQSA